MLAIQHLYLHTDIGRIAFHRCTNTHAIVRTRCQLEVKAIDKVGILILRVKVATETLGRHASDAPILQDVIHRVACPLVHVGAIKQDLEALLLLLLRKLERLLLRQFFHVYITEEATAAMCLQLDLLDRENWLTTIPIVLHDDIINHQLTIQLNGHTVAYHLDVEAIPLSQLVISHLQRDALVLCVVVESA